MPRARRIPTDPLRTFEARRAEARRLAASGLSAREIAELLRYDIKTVRDYLRPDKPAPFDRWGPPGPL